MAGNALRLVISICHEGSSPSARTTFARTKAFVGLASDWKQQENGCSIRQSECVNQGDQSSRLISTAGVVKKITLERWAPISQDLNQASL